MAVAVVVGGVEWNNLAKAGGGGMNRVGESLKAVERSMVERRTTRYAATLE